MAPTIVDARGLRCPWPALRAARALREAGGAAIDVLADDPAAARELTALAISRKMRLQSIANEHFRFVADA